MSDAWLGALLGVVKWEYTPIELAGGINFRGAVNVTRNDIQNTIDVLIGGDEIVLEGDVTGGLVGNVVAGFQGIALLDTVPTTGQAMVYNGSAWTPGTVGTSGLTAASVTRAKLATDALAVAFGSQSGTTYTLVLGDAFTHLRMSNAGAITLTVPTNASVAFAVGTQIAVEQTGAGQVTVAAAGGVTLRTSLTAKTRAQYSVLLLTKLATDEWLISGDMATS